MSIRIREKVENLCLQSQSFSTEGVTRRGLWFGNRQIHCVLCCEESSSCFYPSHVLTRDFESVLLAEGSETENAEACKPSYLRFIPLHPLQS